MIGLRWKQRGRNFDQKLRHIWLFTISAIRPRSAFQAFRAFRRVCTANWSSRKNVNRLWCRSFIALFLESIFWTSMSLGKILDESKSPQGFYGFYVWRSQTLLHTINWFKVIFSSKPLNKFIPRLLIWYYIIHTFPKYICPAVSELISSHLQLHM